MDPSREARWLGKGGETPARPRKNTESQTKSAYQIFLPNKFHPNEIRPLKWARFLEINLSAQKATQQDHYFVKYHPSCRGFPNHQIFYEVLHHWREGGKVALLSSTKPTWPWPLGHGAILPESSTVRRRHCIETFLPGCATAGVVLLLVSIFILSF